VCDWPLGVGERQPEGKIQVRRRPAFVCPSPLSLFPGIWGIEGCGEDEQCGLTNYCRAANDIAPLVFPRNLTRPSRLGEIGCHVD
jgi:hypothetical protein